MTYHNQFVVVVKSNGKILREHGDVVTLPFKSEYSILLKNLSSKRAKVNVHIDGVDVLNGQSIVIGANEEHELEGFLKNDKVKNKFMFIQKTEKIQEHRGDKIDDGIIRVTYQYEQQLPKYIWTTNPTVWYYNNNCPWCQTNPCNCWMGNYPKYGGGSVIGSSLNELKWQDNSTYNSSNIGSTIGGTQSRSCADVSVNYSSPVLDEGITVPGADTNVNYGSAYLGVLESEVFSICLKLRGEVEGQKVVKPMTTNDKVVCGTCGTKSSTLNKFCSECGTALIHGYCKLS